MFRQDSGRARLLDNRARLTTNHRGPDYRRRAQRRLFRGLAMLSVLAMVATALATVAEPVGAQVRGGFPPPLPVDRPSQPTPNVRPDFVWAAAGDSFAAGEGAPFVRSSNLRNVRWQRPGALESTPVRACHRSRRAPAPTVNRQLTADFPAINFDFRFVACSGAKIADLSNTRTNAGPDRLATHNDPAQFGQVASWLGPRKLDAMYLNIGGNDGGFAPIVTTCLLFSCGPEDDRELETEHWEPMEAAFTNFNERQLRPGTPREPDGFDRHLPGKVDPGDVFITTIPNFAEDTDGTICTSSDFERDRFLQNFDVGEISWASTTVLNRINNAIADAASLHGWTLIREHEAAWSGHGICAAVPFANTNSAALANQGDDMHSAALIIAGTLTAAALAPIIIGPAAALLASPFGLALAIKRLPLGGVSAGIAHPNAAGYNTYVNPILNRIRPLVRDKLADGLAAPTNLRVARATRNGPITLRWRDESTTETRHEIEILRIREGGRNIRVGQTFAVAGATTSRTEFTHRISTGALIQYGVKACVRVDPGQPNICGPQAQVWAANNRAPRVQNLVGSVVAGLNTQGGNGRVVVRWDADPSATRWSVRRTNLATGNRTLFNSRYGGLTVPRPSSGANLRFDVVGCNRIGCGTARSITVDTSEVPQNRRPVLPGDLLRHEDVAAILGLVPGSAPNITRLPPLPPQPPVVRNPVTPVRVPTTPAVRTPTTPVRVPTTPAVRNPSTPTVRTPVRAPAIQVQPSRAPATRVPNTRIPATRIVPGR